MKKFKIVIILIVTIILTNAINISSNASFTIQSAKLYSKGQCEYYLKYNGTSIVTTFVVYSNNGIEYPAYCLEREKPGVTESTPYTVNVTEAVSNNLVWRAIINGYPYKSPEQLGCASAEEAFTATKQAVYCVLYGNDENNFERYTSIGEAGERVLNALIHIVTNARNSGYSKSNSNITINEEQTRWEIDNINKHYISKIYNVSSGASISEFNLELLGTVPDGTYVSDLKNNVKTTFKNDERFKILLPLKNLKEDGKFKIVSNGKILTKPILYAVSPNSNYQNYALSGETIELGTGNLEVPFTHNNTKIIILKQDKITKYPIENTEFRILDEEKNVIRSNLKTDSEGKIVLENQLPGKYFIEETKAQEEYNKYVGQIKINLHLNEELTVIVNNGKETIVEVETPPEIVKPVQQEMKLPKAGM